MEQRPYILYADDDEDDVHFFREFLFKARSKNDMVHVKDGYSVIAHLQDVEKGATYPALIVLDMNMPKLSGIETLELLKTDDFYRLIPVVMFTITSDKNHDDICNRLGVDIISKPSDYAHWNLIMEKLCAYSEE